MLGMRAIVGNLCCFRALPLGISKQGICYDRQPRNPVSDLQEFRRVPSEIGCHDRLWHYGCGHENDPDHSCCDKRCAPNCKGPGACAGEEFKSSEATNRPENTAQNLQANDRPPEGSLIQRRAYWSGRLRSFPIKWARRRPIFARSSCRPSRSARLRWG